MITDLDEVAARILAPRVEEEPVVAEVDLAPVEGAEGEEPAAEAAESDAG